MDAHPFEILQQTAAETENTAKKEFAVFEPIINEPLARSPIVYLVRHAESTAKILDSTTRRYTYFVDTVDQKLSIRGDRQCEGVRLYLSQDPSLKLTHLLCSPMSRTLRTSIGIFGSNINEGTKVIAMAELQTFDRGANGTGLSVNDLKARYGDQVSFSLLPEDWNEADQKSVSLNGRYSSAKRNIEKVKEMMERIRSESFPEQVHIGVVTHSSCLRHWVAAEGWETLEIDPYLCDRDDKGHALQGTESKIVRPIPVGMTPKEAAKAR
ncbi:hypothetical protein DL98DRAFT_579827 [Cadophora sp. DSE1049]|nr:hypothetical protein DL98DRAFT_579827 [Cadophora sp. DSE1049]